MLPNSFFVDTDLDSRRETMGRKARYLIRVEWRDSNPCFFLYVLWNKQTSTTLPKICEKGTFRGILKEKSSTLY